MCVGDGMFRDCFRFGHVLVVRGKVTQCAYCNRYADEMLHPTRTLDELNDCFGRDIAGNHSDLTPPDADGFIVARADVDGAPVYFYHSANWDYREFLTPANARRIISTLNLIPKE